MPTILALSATKQQWQQQRPLPLNGLVLHQLEHLTCEVEDIGETAALSASPEIRAGIMEQLAAHGIVSPDGL